MVNFLAGLFSATSVFPFLGVASTHKLFYLCLYWLLVSIKICSVLKNIYVNAIMIATSFCNLLSQSILFSRFVHFDMKIKFAHFSCFSLFEFMIHYSFIPLMRYDVKFPRFFIIAHNTARETLLQFSFCICGIAFLEYIPKNGIVESSTCPNIVKVLFQMVLANYN